MLKEKEQLNRISSLKLSDLKRSIKHNQLKPLQPPKTDGEGSIMSTHSPGPSSNTDELGSRKAIPKPLYKRNTSKKTLMPLQKSSGAKTVASKKPVGSVNLENSGDEASRFNI